MANKLRQATRSVFGILDGSREADAAVDRLKGAGFRNEDISVLMPARGFAARYAHLDSTKAPEGIAAGVTGGALVGGGLGWLAGIGSLAIPGLGPMLAAGPIMGALAGAGVGGAVGGITGALIGLGIPEYEARRYEEIIRDGGVMVSVHVDDREWSRKAKGILEDSGARDIHTSGDLGTGFTHTGFRTLPRPMESDYDDFMYRK